MSEQAGLRLAYDAVERTVGPRLEALVRTGAFAHSTALAARARGLMGKPLNLVTARVWHMANLPAGTDVQRLRVQIGAARPGGAAAENAARGIEPGGGRGVSDRAAEPGERA